MSKFRPPEGLVVSNAPSPRILRAKTLPLNRPRVTPAFPPPQRQISQRSAAGMAVASFLIFVVVSRLPELLGNVAGSSFKIASICTFVALLFCVICGRLVDTFRRPPTVALMALTIWWIAGVPFSFWPGGSVQLFRDLWLFSLESFFVVATLACCTRDLSAYAGATAWSAILVNLTLLKYGTISQDRGSLEFASSLSNPNIAALQLLLGMPFLIFWTRTRGLFSWRGILGLGFAVLSAVLIVTRTGSRSGLMILLVVVLALMSGTKVHVRLGLVVALIVGVIVVIPFIPSYVFNRYGTILTTENSETSEAVGSSKARAEHLRQSIVLTLEHPLMGVGAGQFQGASAVLASKEGVAALWRETHNMYTQLSSELGLTGVVIYLAMIWTSLFPVWKDLRAARRGARLTERHEFARALLISGMGLAINSCFTSIAYQYYWPLLSAMGVAYIRVAELENQIPTLPDQGARLQT